MRAAQLYVLEGEALTENDVEKIKAYCINPVESREASAEKPETLRMQLELPERVETLNGFTALSDEHAAGHGPCYVCGGSAVLPEVF